MSKRYQIKRGSNSAHCCFVATIVDTKSEESEFTGFHPTVAEFLDRGMARLTCKALNKADEVAQHVLSLKKLSVKQAKFLSGLMRKDAADRSPEVAELRAARALKKLNKENANG